MAYSFADSFDLYAALADTINGYWDSSASFTNVSLSATPRFSGQSLQCFVSNQPNILVKSSGQNDAVHHIVFAYRQSATVSGSTIGAGFSLWDGATQQCSIAVRSDGAILLQSGGFLGTTLATYTGAVIASNTWYAFEVEIVINNTTGSFKVRKNGNNVDDFSATSLNTRGGTANNYANKISIGSNGGVVNQFFDDFFWQSSAAAGTWLGDVRSYVRMPASDASVTFSRSGAGGNTQTVPGSGTPVARSATSARYAQYTPSFSGTIGTAICVVGTTNAGNLKCAIFDANGGSGGPGAILGTAVAPVAEVVGTNTFTFTPAVAVSRGVPIWVGFISDTGSPGTFSTSSVATMNAVATVTYAAFPTANPTLSSGPASGINGAVNSSITINANSNNSMVADAQQDATATYVYSSNPGDTDFYGIASTATTPATILMTTTRAYAQKSDAGTRTLAAQLRSGNTVSLTPTTWNPSDKESHTTLSGGNLIATGTSGWESCTRAIAGQSSGKYYWECTLNTITNILSGVGVSLAGVPLSNGIGVSLPAGMCGLNQIGNVYRGGTTVLSGFGTLTNGMVVCIALDVGNNSIWFRIGAGGNWNLNATYNPATGTGGITLFGSSAAHYPMCCVVGDQITANFGATTFIGAVPSGFTSGFGATTVSGTVVTSPTVVLTTSGWLWAWRSDLTDPATGAAWTATAVNNAQIGPKVIA